MIYVEFFENNPIDDICACLSNPPDKVIMIGEGFRKIEKKAKIYEEMMRRRGHDTVFVPRTVGRIQLDNIFAALCAIVEENDPSELAFGITGGDRIYLVALGMVLQKYEGKGLQVHSFNINNGRIYDCDTDGVTIERDFPALSVEENIHLYGGEIIYDGTRDIGGTVRWVMDEEFIEDIDRMWRICRRDPTAWNKKVSSFSEAESLKRNDTAPLVTEVDVRYQKKVNGISCDFLKNKDIFKELHSAGILRSYSWDGRIFKLEYKNEQVKRCLMKAGQVLEMKVYAMALLARDDEGREYYNDAMNGVCIDWDGRVDDEGDTSNEIDVMMMCGTVPIFVSCKNGQVSMDELYKLNTVAARFGGKYAKKVIVATALDPKSDFGKSFKRRANDMHILVETDFDEISDNEMIESVKSFSNISS